MPLSIIIESAADADLDEQLLFLASDNISAAMRFYKAAREGFEKLADMPGIGTLWETDDPGLIGIRRFPIPGFPKYLIFYQVTEVELRIIRIIHGARNICNVLEANEQA